METQLSHYVLLERLGTGGMGTVWRARDSRDGRLVAVKLLHAHLAADAEYIRRFQREARIAATIDSPYVIRVFEAGQDGETHFLAMEYVEGQSLAEHIQERGRLSVEETVKIATAVASGLSAAHSLGIVHRDVSPQNVMLGADGSIKLTDFGVARDLGATAMTATSMLLGKPQYIAPEVVTGQSPVDIRSDLYALGVVMYQMLAGKVPFEAETPFAVMQKQVYTPVPSLRSLRPDTPAWLGNVVARCLAKRTNDRYQAPDAFIADLMRRAASYSATRERSRRSTRSVFTVFGIGAFSVVGIVASLTVGNEGDSSNVRIAPLIETPTAVLAIDDVRPSPLQEAGPEVANVEPDRTDCGSIQASGDYRSEAERDWYMANCVVKAAPAIVTPPIATPVPPGPNSPATSAAVVVTQPPVAFSLTFQKRLESTEELPSTWQGPREVPTYYFVTSGFQGPMQSFGVMSLIPPLNGGNLIYPTLWAWGRDGPDKLYIQIPRGLPSREFTLRIVLNNGTTLESNFLHTP